MTAGHQRLPCRQANEGSERLIWPEEGVEGTAAQPRLEAQSVLRREAHHGTEPIGQLHATLESLGGVALHIQLITTR